MGEYVDKFNMAARWKHSWRRALFVWELELLESLLDELKDILLDPNL